MQVKLIPISPLNINILNSDEYISALNDPECNKYLETRFIPQTLQSVHDYIENLPDNVRFFKIMSKTTSEISKYEKTKAQRIAEIYDNPETWVGNIKLGPINMWHRFAEIGVLIFPKYWNKGYGSEAIKLITDYAFNVLQLRKVFAGCLEPNIASIRAFEKAGFNKEYIIKNQYLTNGGGYTYTDDIVLTKYVT